MGALDELHFNVELENEVRVCDGDLGVEGDNNTLTIQNAVKVLLQGLDEDINREGLWKTPLRVAKAFREGTRGYKHSVEDIVHGALFPEAGPKNIVGRAGGDGGLVLVRDLDLFSYCESCLLPFHIKCHVGYVPAGQRVVGLSKLSRVADVFAKRLQDPQRLANEVCSALHNAIKPTGVALILECSHICLPEIKSLLPDSHLRGWVKVFVSAGSGVFENKNADTWTDFYILLKLGGINVEKANLRVSSDICWCPLQFPLSTNTSSKILQVDPAMVAAVTSIIKSLGEDPLRSELVGTPIRFVEWLMNFQNINIDMKLNICNAGLDSRRNAAGDLLNIDKEMCSELNLSFWSQCEHHILPFYGVVHVGYFGSAGFNPVAKSLLQSIVHFYGFKLQVQERLTRQIAEKVASLLGGDVIIVVEAAHTCMLTRGIEKIGSSTATIAVLGRFSTEPSLRASFLQTIQNNSTSNGQ